MSGPDTTDRCAELGRITLLVLSIGGLIAGSWWSLAPFLRASTWAAMIVVATWPLLASFAGVIGGLVAFGVVGIFVGPVVLAVAYTLLDDWVTREAPDVTDPRHADAVTGQ